MQVTAPWHSTLTGTEHALVGFGIAVAGLSLIAMLIRTWLVRAEVSGRYRPAIAASLGVLTVASLSYVVIYFKFGDGYTQVGSMWRPNDGAMLAWATRYLDWAVTVPLLVVELVAVSSLHGRRIARTRAIGVGAAFLMIATGYIGGIAVHGGEDFAALVGWGIVSSAFFTVLYFLVLTTVMSSLPALPPAARPTYRAAMLLLMGTWFVYPIVFGLQGFTSGGAWATTGQLLLCAADVTAKVGFGLLLHKIAKLRTASDVNAGLETHPETLWIDGERQSSAPTPETIEHASAAPRSLR